MLDRDAAKEALVDADIFVLSSLSENFGMAVAEAMLCGLPVVISENVGLAQDIARADAGVVVTLDPDSKALTLALASLLDNKPRRQTLAEHGRRFAIDNYDEPAVEERVNQLIALATNRTL
jgi:glycosyltransferase involved in cell wall biosynthesis